MDSMFAKKEIEKIFKIALNGCAFISLSVA